MNFEWDIDKAASNFAKHGVSFATAARIFHDPTRLEMYEGKQDYGEARWATIGLVEWSVLYVVYTVRLEDSIRIISARKAAPYEEKQYFQAIT